MFLITLIRTPTQRLTNSAGSVLSCVLNLKEIEKSCKHLIKKREKEESFKHMQMLESLIFTQHAHLVNPLMASPATLANPISQSSYSLSFNSLSLSKNLPFSRNGTSYLQLKTPQNMCFQRNAIKNSSLSSGNNWFCVLGFSRMMLFIKSNIILWIYFHFFVIMGSDTVSLCWRNGVCRNIWCPTSFLLRGLFLDILL